jgi:hypothetical protein
MDFNEAAPDGRRTRWRDGLVIELIEHATSS